MTIYDKKISVYDNLDCIEDAVNSDRDPDIDANDIAEVKSEISRIDDDLNSIIEDLENIDSEHTDQDLTLSQVNEFFEHMLPAVIDELNKLRERLY